MKHRLLLPIIAAALFAISIIFLVTTDSKAQAIFKGCPLGGKPVSHDDSMKNRYDIPTHYKAMDFDELAALKYTDELPKGAISFTGYCILIKSGGSETCNCKSKDKTAMDVHIEITRDSKHTSNKDALVCEINGRVQAIMAAQGIDWSMPTIKKMLVGHTVEIGGYSFADDHHKQNSVVDNPNGTDDWRITTIELHPVTHIKVIQ